MIIPITIPIGLSFGTADSIRCFIKKAHVKINPAIALIMNTKKFFNTALKIFKNILICAV